MANKESKHELKYYDSRVVDRYIRNGSVTHSEYEQHMKGLPDESANAQWVEIELHGTEVTASRTDNGSGGDSELNLNSRVESNSSDEGLS